MRNSITVGMRLPTLTKHYFMMFSLVGGWLLSKRQFLALLEPHLPGTKQHAIIRHKPTSRFEEAGIHAKPKKDSYPK